MAKLTRPGILIPLFFNVALLGVLPSFAHDRYTPMFVMAVFLSLTAPWLVVYVVNAVSRITAREDEKRRQESENSDFV